MNFGEKLDWKLPPLVNKETASRTEYIGNLWLSLICIGLAVSLFLAIFQGSLISTWMFINSMQLIAHVPLISSKLPANAHYFFLNFMGLVRFNLETINSSLDTVSSKLLDYQLIEDENSFYSSQLHSSGYRFSFVRNVLSITCMAALIALVWLFTAVIQLLRKKATGAEANKKTSSSEVFMNNFMVRFLLEVFFELMICAMINVTSVTASGMTWWFISLLTLVAGAVALLAVASLYIKRGPYISDTYAPASLVDSFWGVRHLCEDV